LVKDLKVLAFIDFSQHISFGIPKSHQFTDFTIHPSSENYERITIHKDGKIRTHLPLAQNFLAPWDGQYSRLAKWDKPWCIKENLYWGSKYPQSVRDYLAKPKTSRSDICQLQLRFPQEVEETTVMICLFPSLDFGY